MKFKKFRFISLYLLLLIVIPLHAQDNRTLETKVADLLVQIPAYNQQQLTDQMISLLELGETGLQKVLDMIIPPGTGDDTKPRVAVESLSRYLSQPGLEEEKLSWEALILNEIGSRHDMYVKSFLISQLNYIGGNASIESLSQYLTDIKLHDPAIRVMRDANPRLAASTFAGYLDKTSGMVQIALVNAIGETGLSDHAPAIASLAGSENPGLQRSVLACLATLGDPDSYKILMDAAKTASFLPEPTNATVSLLTFAQTLSENNNHNLSLKICKILQKKCTEPEQIHFKTNALLTAAGNDHIENSVPLLVDALKNGHKVYRMAAVNYAAQYHSPAAPWIAALKASKNNEVTSEILYLFGKLGGNETVETIKGYLNNGDTLIRQQAVQSLAMIQQDEAVPEILKYTLAFPAPPDTETARKVLLQTVGKDHVQSLADKLSNAPGKAKIVLMEVIAAKGNPDHFIYLFDQIDQGGQVRASAIKNLYRIASYDHLNKLLTLFDQLEQEAERLHIEKAIVASIHSSDERPEATGKLLSFVNEKSSQRKYIGVMASVGGEEAMASVYEAYTKGDDATRKMAFNALVKSTDIFALTALYEICSGGQSDSNKELAFRNYVKIVYESTLPDDQKVLLLRKIEPFTTNQGGTKLLIRAMGSAKTFLSFIWLSQYLNVTELQAAAANALVQVVLPSQGLDNGLDGSLVKEKLVRANEIITGPDSEYLKIDIENYLEKMSDQVGFTSMFNGVDLAGWQGLAADPVQKKKLSEKALKELQDEADEKLPENWSVKDNCIVFNGDGANLCSVREYGSFEMIVDWRITKKGDSGIYLRGSPQVQIWDTSRVESGAQVGSGGLYNNQSHKSKPLVVADNPVGDWNTFRITMMDEKVTVYLNGQLVVDNVVMENYWDRNIPIFPAGSVELQAHGTDLAFRDIYIKEL